MAEFLIRVHDKINDDFYLNCQCTKRGDVIVVFPDGHVYGREELTNPDWRILKVPNVDTVSAQTFLAQEQDSDPLHPSRTLQKRAFKLDLSHASIPQAIKDYIADDTRAQASITVPFSKAAFQVLKVQKSPITDPNG